METAIIQSAWRTSRLTFRVLAQFSDAERFATKPRIRIRLRNLGLLSIPGEAYNFQGLNVVLLYMMLVEREHVLIVSYAFDPYTLTFSALLSGGEEVRKMSRNQSSLFQIWRKEDLVQIYGLASS